MAEDDLTKAEELFAFLQGDIPDGYKIAAEHIPRLTADQAWTVIWYLGNQYWRVPDTIERCDVCGELFDSNCEGGYTEEGPPYHFCEACDHLRPVEQEDCDKEEDG